MKQFFLLTVITSGIASFLAQATTSSEKLPSIRFATPLPTSVEIFVSSSCRPVTKWMIQYRKFGDDSSTQSLETEATRITATRVAGLSPNTKYQFRIRPSQVNVTEIENPYPDWESTNTITTGSLSIFGKVTLTNSTYTFSYSRKDSVEWTQCLTTIQEAYHKSFSISLTSLSLLRIESSTANNPVVYYKVKAPDTSLPSNTSYEISGPGLADCVINNGDTAMGRVNIDITSRNGNKKYALWYERGKCPSGFSRAIVERYMIISPEDSASMQIHLNVASSDATSPSEDDGIIVQKTGELRLDNGAVYTKISRGIFVGLTPKFLVKDCLLGSPTSIVYSEIFGPTLYDVNTVTDHVWDKTEYPTLVVDATTMTCKSGYDGEFITCDIPTIQGGYEYSILDGNTDDILASVTYTTIDCSNFTQVLVTNLTSNVTYDLGLKVAVRNSDGTQRSVTSQTTLPVKTTGSIPTTTITVLDPTDSHIKPTSTDDTETTVLSTTSSSAATSLISTTSSTSPSTERHTTTLRTTRVVESDCILPQFGCALTFNQKIGIMIAIAGIIGGIIVGILLHASWRASRKGKYNMQGQC